MSIASEITRLQNAKASLKTSINNKGGTITTELIDAYAPFVDSIATQKPEETKTIASPSFASGDIVVTPDSGRVLTSVTLSKDTTNHIADNIKKDVTLYGITGTYEVTLPTLNAPTISIASSTLTITPNTNNGNFTIGYKVYSDGSLIATIQTTTLDLSAYLTIPATYSITTKAYGTNFNDSVASGSASYTITPPPSGFDVTLPVDNNYSLIGSYCSIWYSLDDGSTWVSISTTTNLTAVSQIKFKVKSTSDSRRVGVGTSSGLMNIVISGYGGTEYTSSNLTVSADVTYYISTQDNS